MSIVIKVENLSKYYRLGLIGGGTLREDLNRWWAMNRGRPDPLLKVGEEDHGNRKGGQIWALRDVSFEVREGEILGIIGRNGAGKSTLLKILSRITAPTSGRAMIKGRVGSLLEVGTGFHPELTGRENIYLNGSILGMSRMEVTSKLEEIVEFAEMSQFIDTPVKRYSSGMTVRLAFAVAAHLEPEILLVDEVLAVGDASFQRKCMGKMGDVAKKGRTILFVSHNMGSIGQLCDRTIWIKNGQTELDGPTETVLSSYLTSDTSQEGQVSWVGGIANKNVSEFRLTASRIKNEQNKVTNTLDGRKAFNIELEYEILESLAFCRIGFSILTTDGITVFASYDTDNIRLSGARKPGCFVGTCTIPGHLLNAGRYVISIAAGDAKTKTFLHLPNVLIFDIVETGTTGSEIVSKRAGVIRPKLVWKKDPGSNLMS